MNDQQSETRNDRSSHWWAAGLLTAIAAGIAFRLIWLRDVEFKMDEATAVYLAREFWDTHEFPLVGVGSSTGLPPPGLNLWLLLAIAGILPTIGPLEMTRAVQIANIVAIILLAWFAQRGIPPAEREPWLWSVALVSVSPLAVLFSRKLWAQELFPLFTLAFLLAWYNRGKVWGAFVWGLVGALLGQVHQTGFLFAAPFAAVTLSLAPRSVRWPAWLCGSVLGAIPLVPWLMAAVGTTVKPAELQNPAIPFGHWVNHVLGLDVRRALGDDFASFLAFPPFRGSPTFAAGLALAASVVIFSLIFISRVRRREESRSSLWTELRGSETGLVLLAGFIGFCTLLASMLHPAYYHYLIVAFSLPFLSLAWIAFAGTGSQRTTPRRLLAAMVVAQAILTVAFLCFVHQTQIIRGDYGTAYGSQPPR